MTTKPKAYIVHDDDENTVVVFAISSVVARREGANEMDTSFEAVDSCRRAPQFDSFAEQGFVPAEELIAAGWWFGCQGCFRKVSTDEIAEDGLLPIYLDHGVWCSNECRDRTHERECKIREAEVAAIEDFKLRILKRFPSVEIITSNTGGAHTAPYANAYEDRGLITLKHVAVMFHFPGEKIGPACLRYDLDDGGPHVPHFVCCSGDRKAFEAFARGEPLKEQVAA